MGTKEAVHTEF